MQVDLDLREQQGMDHINMSIDSYSGHGLKLKSLGGFVFRNMQVFTSQDIHLKERRKDVTCYLTREWIFSKL